ncbi:MAG: ribonuclease P protein component [Proteobacteria bacterium]|nr:ribonuclease P protein component [Pseudomonadota bacterium]
MISFTFPKSEQIVKTRDYKRILEGGRKYVSRYFVLLAIPADKRRAGIIVSKKIGGSVTRHLIKRRIRESYRHLPGLMIPSKQQPWCNESWPPMEFVIIAKKKATTADFHQLKGDLLTAILAVAQKVFTPSAVSQTQSAGDKTSVTKLRPSSHNQT